MIRQDRRQRRNGARARGASRSGTIVLLLALAFALPFADRASAQAVPGSCPASLGSADLIDHDFSASYCELCDDGTIRIEIENPLGPPNAIDFSEIVVTEDLGSSGLTYVPNSTVFSGTNITLPPVVQPVVSGPNGSILTWTLSPAFVMPGNPGGFGNRARLFITFGVRRHPSAPGGEEGLVGANRSIEASVELEPSCAPGETYTTDTGTGTLPLREPEPQIIKRGRNLDAGQGSGSYSDPVYGHENDDVIWRIEVRNNGDAPLQDFVFTDTMAPGNFEIDWVCNSEAAATSAANGSPPASCVPPTSPTSVVGLDVRAAFGGGATPYIVAPAGGSGFYYLVGEITNSCNNRTNTVSDVEWGCQSQPPVGGISATSSGATAGDDALLSTFSDQELDVDVFLEGANLSQPMGARGTITIRIRNLTGGTINHPTGIRVRELLPPQYVIDTTSDPQLLLAPAYGNAYPGMVDTLAWTNPAANTFPLNTTNPALPLSNTDLDFLLTSSSPHPDYPEQVNMIRHGDTVRIRFRTVLIDPTYYDRVADLDVRTEAPNSDPPGTDPTESFQIDNHSEIWFHEFCTPAVEHHLEFDDSDTAEPEDLDIDIVGTELVFILTNTGDPLPLTVRLANNGGHDADDYEAYVTFGEAMVVQTAPSGCSPTSNPPLLPVWSIPVALPSTASVYRCERGTISPGEVELFTFEVVKNTAASFDDDLTFRADVIGEIWLADEVTQPDGSTGAQLWFPTPVARPDGITDRANNYSIDAVWARVVGYNLFKDQLGLCTENNVPPPGDPDSEVQIGEECTVHIESGGWFGFRTPGFQYIAVQDVQVVDEIPDGQGYISSTDPLAQSTAAILGVSLNPPPAPLDEAWFDWTFNTVVPAERITEKDHWFRVDVTTRLLNDPIDSSAPPNEHAAISTNVLTSTFQAVFFNDSTMMEEIYDLGPNTVGYPREVHRRVDLTVTEPLLTVTKEVCNETRYGAGPACSNFVALADDGDAFDSYVYRITVSNEAAASGVTRAPAYDVTVTSVTDPSDQLFVQPLATDTVDDDGDGDVDAADTDGEGTITDNVLQNAVPAEVIASYTHSDALLRIDPGASVELYYRVDPDDDVAPLQLLTSSVTASYDSLEGASGAQTAPQGANGEIGGARQYVSNEAEAQIRIIPVEVTPKQITALSNTPLSAPVSPQPVSIGEEIAFELHTLIPVAQLRSFVIRDELPAGLRCVEAPDVDLGAPPYDAAGFVPGGVITPTCTDTEVVWDFGDQTVTMSPRADRRFDLGIGFIARVDNALANQDGLVIRNGGASTVTEVRYVDEAGNTVVLEIGEASVVVQEPDLVLEKAFSVAQADAGDVLPVTITATNQGTAPAYDLRVWDDLSTVGLRYAGNVSGTDPPTPDTTTFGADSPLFTWPAGLEILPGESVVFTFDVEVEIGAQPLEVLPNTVQADWTSLPGDDTALNSTGAIGAAGSATGMRNGALPNAGDALNDYETEATASVSVPPVAIDKLDVDPAFVPEIGAHKPFELVISLPEGTTQDLVATDDLASGGTSFVLADNADFDVVYAFSGIATINGQPPSEAALLAVPADGTSGAATWTIGTVVTDAEDDLVASAVSPEIRITYHARVNNDLATNVGGTLQNGVDVTYTNGETGLPETLTDDTPAVVAIEPDLTATKALTNVTPGKAAGDPPALGDVLQYVVTIVNGGNATAYDVNVVDTLPPEVVLFGGFTPTATIGGSAVTGFVATPAGAPAGPLVWGKGNGDESLDVPAGSALVLTYQVTVTAVLNGTTIANEIWVDWTSRPGPDVYERTGDGCPIVTPPDDYCFGPAIAVGTADPLPPVGPLLKENTQDTASIGETFTWRITVPAAPFAYDLYDVRILDDLAASAADVRFAGVTKISGSGPWTPVNTGTPTDLVIEDTSVGIDIPAGEQIVIEIAVVLEDTPTNVAGLAFTNTASFLWNIFDGDDASQLPGDPDTSPPMTVVEPDLTLTKSGPATMTIGAPETFTLDVQNAGDGPAWNATVTDLLPSIASGGTCDTAPAAITAQVFESDGTTAVSGVLVPGTDYTVTWDPAPACLLTLQMLSADTAIGPDQRLIVTYEAQLDTDSQDGAVLTNVAGAIQWWSWDDTSADRRVYDEVVTDGTPLVLDHQDAHDVTVALPSLRFEKTVANVTSGVDPAATATPGDVLRYTLTVENEGGAPLDDFSLVDDLGSLNATAVFVPGSLAVVTAPAGADASNTNPTGGTNGTGLLDVRGLALPNPGDSLVVEFEVTLAAVLPNGTLVTNQSQLVIAGTPFAQSDDPILNGPADPDVAGDEDPTVVEIVSAPAFTIEKISTYLGADPTVLLAGDPLRYTITVVNVGTEDATQVVLRDAIPANTSYVAGSTTLNGAPVPDAAGGVAPLAAGLLISAPSDPTPGVLLADAAAPAANTATLTFDVIVDPNAIDGTIISNQAFVTTVPGGVVDQPSDDPRTPLPDDPTRDVVGDVPLLFAAKDVVLIDAVGGTPGLVDPGDTLRYTISVHNSGAVAATNVSLQDAVPTNTTYLADTTTLNGLPVGQPDAGVAPLVAGFAISSSDLTPPLPAAGAGTITPGETATVVFDVVVDNVPAGTLITNQATLMSVEVPNLLTDGDGDPSTGPEPTVVVVGDGQQLAITKQVAVVGGGAALPGATLEYVVRVVNIAAVPAFSVVITDDLDVPVPGYLAYVAGSATLNGATTGLTVVGSLLTADYSTSYGPLQPGEAAVLRFQAVIDPGLVPGTTITNTGTVTWNTPPQTASASVSIDVGGMPGVGVLNGSVWHDADFDDAQGPSERLLAGWSVDLYRNGQPVQTATTDASGAYTLAGLVPNDLSGDSYEVRFRAPGAGPNTAALGLAASPFTNGLQQIQDIVVPSGANLQGLDLPIDPNGVVYDALSRAPIAGAALMLLSPSGATPLPAGCFDDPVQQGQVTGADGHYKFDLNFSDAACPSGASYLIAVAPPGSGYGAGVSQIIPPTTDATTAPFVVPGCAGGAGDAVITTAQHCEVQPSELAPAPSVRPQTPGTAYHLHLTFDASQAPGTSQIFNNHIALDPVLGGAIGISKTTPSVNVSRGQLVPYQITVRNDLGAPIPDFGIVDRIPAGFQYVEGSAQLDGVPLEPVRNGLELRWDDVGIDAASTRTLVLLLAVGAGVSDGEFVNRAWAVSSASGIAISGEARATVRVVPDPTFACTDVMGKVFDDANANGIQDPGEPGLQGVRLVTARGLHATTDAHGRYHITCATVPNEFRGSNFVLKLDDRSLPSGYRMSTRQVQVHRATQGKTLRFNYAASIHRVVSIDMADPVFEPGTTTVRPQWEPRLGLLLEELRKAPSVLRLSYVADVEDPALVQQRLDAIEARIADAWRAQDPAYALTIEPEVYWRRGGPPERPSFHGVSDFSLPLPLPAGAPAAGDLDVDVP